MKHIFICLSHIVVRFRLHRKKNTLIADELQKVKDSGSFPKGGSTCKADFLLTKVTELGM